MREEDDSHGPPLRPVYILDYVVVAGFGCDGRRASNGVEGGHDSTDV